jgi:hypothetical protein
VGQRGPEHDLHHFAANLAATTDVRAIKQTCMEVQRVIEGRGARSPIIAEGHVASRTQPARGLSICFPPFRDPSAFYRDLDFARQTRRAEFLEKYLRK